MAYTNIDDPSAHFQTVLWTGNGTAGNAVTFNGNSDMQPDFVWSKRRDSTTHHVLKDTSRGGTSNNDQHLVSSLDQPESTYVQYRMNFDSNGFTLGSVGDSGFQGIGTSMVSWCWKANGGTTSSNTDGSITSTVQANQDAGFSIVQYTGTGTAATIGHGLGVTPAMYIIKNRDQTGTNWTVYNKDLTSNAYSLYLNDASLESNAVGYWNGTSPTSTVFSIKNTSGDVNTNTEDYVAYCFASKQGYSKFGKYIGNGSYDGPFVYTGFKPAFLIVKRLLGSDWRMLDNARNPFNYTDLLLNANYIFADSDGSSHPNNIGVDFLSNGFKTRTIYSHFNTNAYTHLYMAFAENPFVTSTGVPTTAR
jgi:hypothetical protein